MANAEAKWRAYLTASQLQLLVSKLDDTSESLDEIKLRNTLSVLLFKATKGITKEAYTAVPKETVAEKLGLTTGGDSLESVRYRCYSAYRLGTLTLTETEIYHAETYMYEHDLMTPEAEAEYEQRIGI